MKPTLIAQVDFNSIFNELKKYGIEIKLPGSAGPGSLPIQNATLWDIISAILPYIFVLAGLILFLILIAGGFGFLTAAGNPESIKKSQAKITNALLGFLIIFVAYWLVQILEIILGVTIFE